MGMLNELESRDKGFIDISIGTALGIQAALGLGEEGEVVSDPPLRQYNELLINLRTLFRNIYSHLQGSQRYNVDPEELALVLTTEMRIINSIVERFVGASTRVSYYACEYDDFTSRYKHCFFKQANTDLQKLYASLENATIGLVKQEMETDPIEVRLFNTVIDGRDKRSLIVTHYPVDLLNKDSFSQLDLLETHTGAIKKPTQWNTKLKGKDEELARIPFNVMTVQLFGDSGGMLSPYPIKIRDELIKVAEKYRWHPATTKSRILLTVKQHRNFTLEKTVRLLYR